MRVSLVSVVVVVVLKGTNQGSAHSAVQTVRVRSYDSDFANRSRNPHPSYHLGLVNVKNQR